MFAPESYFTTSNGGKCPPGYDRAWCEQFFNERGPTADPTVFAVVHADHYVDTVSGVIAQEVVGIGGMPAYDLSTTEGRAAERADLQARKVAQGVTTNVYFGQKGPDGVVQMQYGADPAAVDALRRSVAGASAGSGIPETLARFNPALLTPGAGLNEAGSLDDGFSLNLASLPRWTWLALAAVVFLLLSRR